MEKINKPMIQNRELTETFSCIYGKLPYDEDGTINQWGGMTGYLVVAVGKTAHFI